MFTSYLRYPTVTKPMLRISLSYFHTEQDIDRLFEILVTKKIEVIVMYSIKMRSSNQDVHISGAETICEFDKNRTDGTKVL